MTPPNEASSATAPAGVKHFVLDTNVLLHNPDALFVFEDNHVVIPFPVIEELDTMKRREDDVGRNARETIRHLDRIRQSGRLIDGVDLAKVGVHSGSAAGSATGTLRIDVGEHERPASIVHDSPDNHIIAVAWTLAQEGGPVVFVSKDLAARIKADALGIRTEDFENQKVDADRLYSGYHEIDAARKDIDDLYRDRMLELERVKPQMTVKLDDGSEVQPQDVLLEQDELRRVPAFAERPRQVAVELDGSDTTRRLDQRRRQRATRGPAVPALRRCLRRPARWAGCR